MISIEQEMAMDTFTDLVGCRLPLQLAGMGGTGADVALPAAVTSAGGLGMVGAAGLPARQLEAILGDLSRTANGPFGVNFLIPFLDRDALAVAAKGAPVVEFFYGDPDAELVELVHEHRKIAGWQVGTAAEAESAVAAGCDYVVAQGHEAGGHVRGELTRRDLLSLLAGRVAKPVVVAGGVATAEDVVGAIEAGASAVRVGTRLVAAMESIAHPAYVNGLIAASSADTQITRTFSLGWDAPHRVLRSSIEAAERAPEGIVGTVVAPDGEWPVPRFSTLPPTKATRGNVAAMAMYAGTSVDGVLRRAPASAIVAELTSLL